MESIGRESPFTAASFLILFKYAGSSLSNCRCNNSTPSKPTSAAFSMILSNGTFGPRKCQYEYVDTVRCVRGAASKGAASVKGNARRVIMPKLQLRTVEAPADSSPAS